MKRTLSITDARRKFSRMLDRIERGERIVITRYGKPFVAVIPIAEFQLLARSKKDPMRS